MNYRTKIKIAGALGEMDDPDRGILGDVGHYIGTSSGSETLGAIAAPAGLFGLEQVLGRQSPVAEGSVDDILRNRLVRNIEKAYGKKVYLHKAPGRDAFGGDWTHSFHMSGDASPSDLARRVGYYLRDREPSGGLAIRLARSGPLTGLLSALGIVTTGYSTDRDVARNSALLTDAAVLPYALHELAGAGKGYGLMREAGAGALKSLGVFRRLPSKLSLLALPWAVYAAKDWLGGYHKK